MMRITDEQFAEACRHRRAGFAEAVRALCASDGAFLSIDPKQWLALTVEFSFAKGAAPLVPHVPLTRDQVAARDAACAACAWHGHREGFERCEHPARKCSKLYPAAPSERCPLDQWPTSSPPPSSGSSC